MIKLDVEKAEESEIKLPTSVESLKKQENSRKTYTSALLSMPKPLCASQQTVENSERDGDTRPPDSVNVDLAKKAYALQSDVSNRIFSIPAI